MSANNDVAGYRPREDWPTIAQLAEGYDEYTLPDSTKLAKQSVTFVFENKIVIRHDYKDAENLTWTVLEGAGVPGYEAGMTQDEEVTLIYNVETGQAIFGISGFHDVKGAPRTHTILVNAVREGTTSAPFQVTEELLGKVVLYKYNTRDVYEHSYQNPGTFAWHCLSSIEKGVASSDPCKYVKIDEELYLIWWSETVMPVESMIVSDLKNLRSTGRFFCWDPKPRKPMHMVFGSYATVAADLKAKRTEVMAKI